MGQQVKPWVVEPIDPSRYQEYGIEEPRPSPATKQWVVEPIDPSRFREYGIEEPPANDSMAQASQRHHQVAGRLRSAKEWVVEPIEDPSQYGLEQPQTASITPRDRGLLDKPHAVKQRLLAPLNEPGGSGAFTKVPEVSLEQAKQIQRGATLTPGGFVVTDKDVPATKGIPVPDEVLVLYPNAVRGPKGVIGQRDATGQFQPLAYQDEIEEMEQTGATYAGKRDRIIKAPEIPEDAGPKDTYKGPVGMPPPGLVQDLTGLERDKTGAWIGTYNGKRVRVVGTPEKKVGLWEQLATGTLESQGVSTKMPSDYERALIGPLNQWQRVALANAKHFGNVEYGRANLGIIPDEIGGVDRLKRITRRMDMDVPDELFAPFEVSQKGMSDDEKRANNTERWRVLDEIHGIASKRAETALQWEDEKTRRGQTLSAKTAEMIVGMIPYMQNISLGFLLPYLGFVGPEALTKREELYADKVALDDQGQVRRVGQGLRGTELDGKAWISASVEFAVESVAGEATVGAGKRLGGVAKYLVPSKLRERIGAWVAQQGEKKIPKALKGIRKAPKVIPGLHDAPTEVYEEYVEQVIKDGFNLDNEYKQAGLGNIPQGLTALNQKFPELVLSMVLFGSAHKTLGLSYYLASQGKWTPTDIRDALVLMGETPSESHEKNLDRLAEKWGVETEGLELDAIADAVFERIQAYQNETLEMAGQKEFGKDWSGLEGPLRPGPGPGSGGPGGGAGGAAVEPEPAPAPVGEFRDVAVAPKEMPGLEDILASPEVPPPAPAETVSPVSAAKVPAAMKAAGEVPAVETARRDAIERVRSGEYSKTDLVVAGGGSSVVQRGDAAQFLREFDETLADEDVERILDATGHTGIKRRDKARRRYKLEDVLKTHMGRGEQPVRLEDVPEAQRWEAATPRGPEGGQAVHVRGRWAVADVGDFEIPERGSDDPTQLKAANQASREQQASIAAKPDPLRLGDSPVTDVGAPITDSTRKALTARTRLRGIAQAYEAGTAGQYEAEIRRLAEQRGLDTAGIARPVLYREIHDFGGLSPEEFAELSDRQAGSRMGAAEQARADSRYLPDIIHLFNPDNAGYVRAASNQEFLKAFVNATGDESLRTSEGGFSPDIDSRVRRAMLAAVLGETGNFQAVVDAIESAEELGIQRQLHGVMMAGGALLKVADAKPAYDLAPHLGAALRELIAFRRARARGEVRTLQEHMAQGDMFAEKTPVEVDLLVEELETRKAIKGVRAFLDRYVELAGKIDTDTGSLFGEEVPETTVRELLEMAREEGRDEAGEQADLLESLGTVASREEEPAKQPVQGAETGRGRDQGRRVTESQSVANELPREYREGIRRFLLKEDDPSYVPEEELALALRDVVEAGRRARPLRLRLPVQAGTRSPAGRRDYTSERVRPERDPRTMEKVPRKGRTDLREGSETGRVPVAAGRSDIAGVELLGTRISETLARKGRIDLRGQQFTDVAELAELVQVFRDPRFETFRLVYVKDGRIVAHHGVTSGFPGAAKVMPEGTTPQRYVSDLRRRIERLGADGYYLVHNHPSGDVEPSEQDRQLTANYTTVPGLLGHIIIDHGEFTFLEATVRAGHVEVSYDVHKVPESTPFFKDHGVFGNENLDEIQTARILVELEADPNKVTILYNDRRHILTAAQSVPPGIFNFYDDALAFLRGQAKAFGATGIVVGIGESSEYIEATIEQLMDDGHVIALFNLNTGQSKLGKNPKGALVPGFDTFFGAPIKGRATRFSTRPQAAQDRAAGVSVEAAEKALESLRRKWKGGPKKLVAARFADVPEPLQQKAPPGARGVYDPDSDTVYVFADRVADAQEAAFVAVHEVVGHRGVEAVLGKEADQFYGWLARARARDIRKHAKRKGVPFVTESERRAAAKEWFADRLAENDTSEGFRKAWNRLIELLQKALRRITGQKWTDDLIEAVARAAFVHAETGVVEEGRRVTGEGALQPQPLYSTADREKHEGWWREAGKDALAVLGDAKVYAKMAWPWSEAGTEFRKMRHTAKAKARPDAMALETVFLQPSHWADKIPAYLRTFEHSQRRLEVREQVELDIWEGKPGDRDVEPGVHRARIMRDYARDNPEEYARVREELKRMDQYKIARKVVKDDDATWHVANFDGRPLPGTYASEWDALNAMFDLQEADWRRKGFSEEGARYVRVLRTVGAKAYDRYMRPALEHEANLKALGIDLSKPRPELEKRLKALGLNPSEMPIIDIIGHLKEMGDLRDSYMPRMHTQGKWWVFLEKEGENPYERFFDTRLVASAWAAQEKLAGWKVSAPAQVNRPAQDVWINTKIADIEDVVNIALGQMDEEPVGEPALSDFGLEAVSKETVDGIPELVVTGRISPAIRAVFAEHRAQYYDSGEGEGPGWHFKGPHVPGEGWKGVGEDFAGRLAAELAASPIDRARPAIAFANAFAETIANLNKARGSQARKIRRSEAAGEEVVEGYEEDPNTAFSRYVSALAGGQAKLEVGQAMMEAITGTDIPWDDFYNEHADPEIEEGSPEWWAERQRLKYGYQDLVNERRIHSGKQTNAYRDALSLYKETMRNDEAMDRAFGVLRSVTAVNYLARAFGAVVNLTSQVITAPPAIARMTGATLLQVQKAMAVADKEYTKYLLEKDLGGDIAVTRILKAVGKHSVAYVTGKLDQDYEEAFDELRQRGRHRSQYNREALNLAKSKVGRTLGALMDNAMSAMGVSEEANRASTHAAAQVLQLRAARAKGDGWGRADEAAAERAGTPWTPETRKARQTAKDEAWKKSDKASDKAHGVYGPENLPKFARGASIQAQAARSMLMFKVFPWNMLVLQLRDLGWNGLRESAGGAIRLGKGDTAAIADILNERTKGFLWITTMQLLLGGTVAVPLSGAALWMLKVLMGWLGYDGDDPEEEAYRWIERNHGEMAGRVSRQGLPALVGVNLQGSLSVEFPEPSYRSGWEAIIETLLGASGSMILDKKDGLKFLAGGDALKGLEKLMPVTPGVQIKAVREYTEGVTSRGNVPRFYGEEPLRLSEYEAGLRLLGGNPSRVSMIREKQWAEKQAERTYANRRSGIAKRIRNWKAGGGTQPDAQWKRILRDIKAYNDRIVEMGYTAIPFIDNGTINRAISSYETPPKKERERFEDHGILEAPEISEDLKPAKKVSGWKGSSWKGSARKASSWKAPSFR